MGSSFWLREPWPPALPRDLGGETDRIHVCPCVLAPEQCQGQCLSLSHTTQEKHYSLKHSTASSWDDNSIPKYHLWKRCLFFWWQKCPQKHRIYVNKNLWFPWKIKSKYNIFLRQMLLSCLLRKNRTWANALPHTSNTNRRGLSTSAPCLGGNTEGAKV